DAVAVEMTTNTWEVYDLLLPHVHSVTVVHPPHVALIVRAQVKTDRKAALALAQLHAAGPLVGIWVPPNEVRDARALMAQRAKMVRLATTAKNRLHSTLHRHHFAAPETSLPFSPKHQEFWLNLPVSAAERAVILCDWETVQFAQHQKELLEAGIAQVVADDPRVPLLVQLPGIGLIGAATLLAAIGDIRRFPSAEQLVGYAGLGARVHDSGHLHQSGRITKAGRKDIRYTLVEAARHAVRSHPHWKAELARLEPRLGMPKAIVAIARKLLVAIWHVLTNEEADRFAQPVQVACALFAHAYRLGIPNLPEGQSALEYTRANLDRLKLGRELTHIPWGSKQFKLPPSSLAS
ncbi:MAG: IS110 family transposase, partial [Chloroflexi bacterium]|nr:IS110 family transposase [Chloroflexota bacterium]